HAQTRHGVRPHGRVRMGLHGTRGGQVPVRLAGEERRAGRAERHEGDSVHADGDAAGVAGAPASRDTDGGCGRAPDESRRAAAGRLEFAGVSRVRGEDHHRTRQALRARQAGVGLAARQRTEPLREAILLFARGHAAVPRLAAREIRQHRPAEHGLGHRFLVDGIPEFRPDRDSQPTGAPRPAESARATGFRPLVGQGGGRLPAYAGWAAAAVRHRPVDHDQLHGDARRYRSDAFRQGSGRLQLDALSSAWRRFPRERAVGIPVGERRGAELHARLHAAHQRHLGSDGTAAGAGQLGRDQPVAAARRDSHVDSAGVRGARMVCTYRYRQPLIGSEQYHKGLVETDGVTPSPGGLEYAEAMRDVIGLRAKYRADAKEPVEYGKRRTAFLINFDNRWDIEDHKQTTRWDTVEHWMKYYRALKSMMAPVDVVTEDRDLSHYPFVVAPAYQLVDDALIGRWTAYAENGGNLVLTARSGQKDRRGHFPETLWAERLYGLIGARLPIYDV